jgi:hypothetical protein
MRFILTLSLLLYFFNAFSQVYLQLELVNDPQTKKYTVGDEITYKTSYTGDIWVTGQIKDILIDDNALVLSNELLSLEHVTYFRTYRKSLLYLTGMLKSFGILWTGYGTVLSALQRPGITWGQTLSVGLGSFATGYILQKLFYKVPIKLGENNRLRIVDTRFSID